MAENILRAFNGTLDLRAAYSYNAGQVRSDFGSTYSAE